jgi:hypothetical protein
MRAIGPGSYRSNSRPHKARGEISTHEDDGLDDGEFPLIPLLDGLLDGELDCGLIVPPSRVPDIPLELIPDGRLALVLRDEPVPVRPEGDVERPVAEERPAVEEERLLGVLVLPVVRDCVRVPLVVPGRLRLEAARDDAPPDVEDEPERYCEPPAVASWPCMPLSAPIPTRS